MHCCLYWLFDESCSVPENDGYIGVTTNLPQRLHEHKSKGRRVWTGVRVLFVGTIAECLEKEIAYRPFPGIGWNSNSGGTSGKMLSEATRIKLSRWQIGRTLSAEHRQKLKEAHANRSPEEKARLAELYGRLAIGNKSRTGQTFSTETRAKLSAAKLGNKNAVGNKSAVGHIVTPEHRAMLSRRMKNNQIRLGATLSDETKRKIGASQRLRLAKRRELTTA